MYPQAPATCECHNLDDDLTAEGWTCHACYEMKETPRQITYAEARRTWEKLTERYNREYNATRAAWDALDGQLPAAEVRAWLERAVEIINRARLTLP